MSDATDERSGSEIAIVGIAGRFAGAPDLETFWQNLKNGVESIRRYDDDELRAKGVDDATLADPAYVKAGGELPDVDGFDAGFFGFGPKDAAITDPQHRHFLECAWTALESAGHPPARFPGSIGVFAGCGMNGYFVYNLLRNPKIVASTGAFLLRHTGNDRDFLPTTVSYKLNLTGPSVAIQTACSTSLVAIHVACQSLLSGECDMAVAGGVTVIIPPGQGYHYNENEPLAPDGHCRAFDARGSGTVLTSGVGVVALRRLDDALADGDVIHAVIRGSAINNDGSRKIGYLAPSVDGQAAVIAEALAVAGLPADAISYVETHGTGTNVGDPIEVSALTQAYRQSTDARRFCGIGSNKPNIGHTDTAAGIASVLKVVMAMREGLLPPSIGFERPNPNIPWDETPFFVNTELREWKTNGKPRRAGVSSLGVGGTNAHAILEEPPARERGARSRDLQIFPLSAKTASALDRAAADLAACVRAHPELDPADVAHTLQVGRDAFEHRRVVVASGLDDLAAALDANDARRVISARAKPGKPSLVFMFPGAGVQFPNMGRGLYEREPVYRAAMDECLEIARGEFPFDLRALLFPRVGDEESTRERLAEPGACLAATFATEWALTRLWASWGVEPDAMTGHSMGEYTAACCAGVMRLRDALRMVSVRGRLVESLRDPGRMLSIALPPDELRAILPPSLDLGVVNGPALCVVAGPDAEIERFSAELERREIEVRPLRVRGAGHARTLDPILDEFRACVSAIELSEPQVPYVSNLTGTWIRPEDATDPEYWVRHLRQPVLFSQGLATLLEGEDRVLVEVGPGQTLCSLARQQKAAPRAAIPSLRRPDDAVDDLAHALGAFGRLFACGHPAPWEALRGEERRLRVSLPTYPFEHQRYWVDPEKTAQTGRSTEADLTPAGDVGEWFWRPSWRPAPPPASEPESTPASWLIFADNTGVAARLAAQLEAQGHTITTVKEGDAFYRLSESEYAISPETGLDAYVDLVRDLVERGRVPDRIAHLWLVTADESARPGSNFFHRNEERGFYSLLWLAQALGSEELRAPIHLAVVTNGMQAVGDEALRYPEKALALGPVGVIPQELPNVTCQSIDLDAPEPGRRGRARLRVPDAVVARLGKDIDPVNAERALAYRGEQRFVQELERVTLPGVAGAGAGLRPRGCYLITGGLGGLGLLVAEHLARHAQARLVLVGRSALPEREAWTTWLESHGSTDPTSRKLRQLLSLEALGAELLIAQADVANFARMSEVVAEARDRFGRIDGVFHVAGAIDDSPLQAKTQTSIETVFAPKVHGTLVLDKLLPDVELFVLFSSTSSAIGAAGQIDYTAASAYLNAFAAHRRARGGKRTLAIDWGVWRDVGLAVDAYDRLGGRPAGRPSGHPLLGQRVADTQAQVVFSHVHRGPGHWILDDHRNAAGEALIPGTGYLELVRAAFAEVEGPGPCEIRDAFFLAPLAVGDGEEVEVRLTLRRGDASFAVEIESRSGDSREWKLHAQAEVARLTGEPPAAPAVAEIRARLPRLEQANDGAALRTLHDRHVRFGARWQVLRTMRFGADEALAELELPAEFASDLGTFALHPALLDLSTGFATPLIEGYRGEQLYAPMSYARVRVHRALPKRVISHVRSVGRNDVGKEVAVFDVTLRDESGAVLVEVERFTVKKLAPQATLSARGRATAGARAAGTRGNADTVTPAEQVFRRSYELGIRPEPGMQALDRVLGGPRLPQVFVSSVDLPQLIARTRAAGRLTEAPSGKFARPELETSYVAPRDELERKLAELWQELLGVDRIGIRDDFFELGGHSLIAVRLFARIKKTWEIEYPISLLFEAPNVEKCADVLRADLGLELGAGAEQAEKPKSERRARFLVPLQKGDAARTPFFLVAGMFGNVLNLRHIANHLGSDQTVYALQAKGLLGDDEPHRRFEDMARDYLAEVRSVQPEGPYLLGGFSGGGITAFEMAQQLLAQDQEVALLVLLDSIPAEEVPLTTARKLRMHWGKLRREGPRYLWDRVASQVRWRLERARQRREPVARDLSPAEFRSEQVKDAFYEALGHYRTGVYPGKVVLFRPSHEDWIDLGGGLVVNPHNRGQIADDQNRFGPHVAGPIEVHVVTGDHDAMVLEPHVRELAEELRRCLDEALQIKAGA